jgi:hypothetical protein
MGRVSADTARIAPVSQQRGASWRKFMWTWGLTSSFGRCVPASVVLVMARCWGDVFLSVFAVALSASSFCSMLSDSLFLGALCARKRPSVLLHHNALVVLCASMLYCVREVFLHFSFWNACVLGCASSFGLAIWSWQLLWVTDRGDIVFGIRSFVLRIQLQALVYEAHCRRWRYSASPTSME